MKVQKKENQNEKSKVVKFFEFPSKLNTIAITLIVVAYLIVAGILIGVVDNYKEYTIKPDYEELENSGKLNTFIKIYSNYTLDDHDHLTKKDNIILACYAKSENNVTDLKGRISTLHEDGTMYYHKDKTPVASKITTNTVYLTNSKSFDSNVSEIFGEFSYKYKENEAIKDVDYTFAEEVLELTKKDKKEDEINEFVSATYVAKDGEKEIEQKLFGKFTMSVTQDEANDVNEVSVQFSISTSLKGNYHLDLQTFAVSDDEVYPLVGYYNMSNDIISSYSQKAKLPIDLDVDYIYAKANYVVYYVNEAGEIIDSVEYSLLFKQEFSTLIK